MHGSTVFFMVPPSSCFIERNATLRASSTKYEYSNKTSRNVYYSQTVEAVQVYSPTPATDTATQGAKLCERDRQTDREIERERERGRNEG